MYIDTEGAIQINHIQVRSQHVSWIGMTGSGKTNGVFVWIEEELATGSLVTVIDSEGDFYPLKGCGLLIIGKGRKGNPIDIPVGPEQAARMAEIVSSHQIPVIVDLSGFSIQERDAFVLAYLGRLWELYQQEDLPPMRVVIDEVQLFAPQGRVTASKDLLLNIAFRGRKRYFAMAVATQRPQSVDKAILDACAVRVFLKVELGRALSAVRDLLPGEMQKKAEDILPSFVTGQAVIKLGAASHIIQIRQSAIFEQKNQPSPAMAVAVINEDTIRALVAALQLPSNVQVGDGLTDLPHTGKSKAVVITEAAHPLVEENRQLRAQVALLEKRIEELTSDDALRASHPLLQLEVTSPDGAPAVIHQPVQPYLSDLAMERRVNAQQRTFGSMIRELRRMQPASRKTLKELVIQGHAVTASELARLADLSESTVSHSHCYGPLVRLGLIKKLNDGKFVSTADAYLRENCANLDHDALIKQLASVI